MDISILYRNTQKYFDRALEPFKLTYGQLPVLLFVYENEGTTMQNIVENGQYDKGTVTKNVQKLEHLGYIKTVPSSYDKRQKFLFPTRKCAEVISKIYRIRQDWWMNTIEGIETDEIESFETIYEKLSLNAHKAADLDLSEIRFYNHEKESFTTYPGKICTQLTVSGCNLKCIGCNQRSLVYLKEDRAFLSQTKIAHFLDERKTFLQAVNIHGGEATLHPELLPFFLYAKSLGYLIQIETNGTNPELIKEWIKQKAIDRIIIHIKSDQEHYPQIVRIEDFDPKKIDETIALCKEYAIDHAIQTPMIDESMDLPIVEQIARWIHGAPLWIWKNYHEISESTSPDLHGIALEKLEQWKEQVKTHVGRIVIRT